MFYNQIDETFSRSRSPRQHKNTISRCTVFNERRVGRKGGEPPYTKRLYGHLSEHSKVVEVKADSLQRFFVLAGQWLV